MNTGVTFQAGLGAGVLFSDNDEIEVSRRRQGAGGGRPDTSERADAPARRRGSGDAGGGGGGGGGGSPFGSGGGNGLPGGGRMPIWLLILLVIAYGLYTLITGGSPAMLTGSSGQEPTSLPVEQVVDTQPAQPALEQPTAVEPVSPPATLNPAAAGQTWTVMLYEDADDPVLEEDMMMDMNEVERVGSTDQLRIVAQIDRYKGGYTGDGNWSGARRYFMRKDADLKALHSDMLQDLGEVNMSSGQTLVDFVTWAAKTYPADKYMLVLSDHGMGWPGGWSDADSGGKDPTSSIPLVAQVGDNLYTMELDKALTAARQQAGIDKFELIGMDACLMSHLEVFTMLQAHARYAVASQETEPALGWAYAGFLGALTQNPGMTGADVGQRIVASYIQDDLRITDDQARADYLRQGSPLGGLFSQSATSAGQLAREIGKDVTLTAADLSGLPALNQAVNTLAYALQSEDQSVVAAARSHAESYTNIFSDKLPAPYIDLGSFVQILESESSNAQVKQAAGQVLDGIHKVVVAEKHGAARQGSTGITIYFPNSTLYRSPVGGAQSYTGIASRFAATSLWDDFLAFHYNDISFKADSTKAVVPGPSAASRAPGLGKISLGPITLSAKTAAPGQPVTLRSQVNGQNIGYIYLFVAYLDPAANSLKVIDTDYLQSAETRQIDGVFYPKWKETGAFTLKLQWDPTVFQISDGTRKVTALMTPESYGAQPEEAVYTVDGTFTSAAGDVTRRARLYFQGGALKHVYGFNGTDQAGAPSEITPQPGDTFTIQETWLDLDANGQVTQTATQNGQTLTFGDSMFTWKEVYAAAGKYVVGFIVEDLDGNRQEVFTTVTVK